MRYSSSTRPINITSSAIRRDRSLQNVVAPSSLLSLASGLRAEVQLLVRLRSAIKIGMLLYRHHQPS